MKIVGLLLKTFEKNKHTNHLLPIPIDKMDKIEDKYRLIIDGAKFKSIHKDSIEFVNFKNSIVEFDEELIAFMKNCKYKLDYLINLRKMIRITLEYVTIEFINVYHSHSQLLNINESIEKCKEKEKEKEKCKEKEQNLCRCQCCWNKKYYLQISSNCFSFLIYDSEFEYVFKYLTSKYFINIKLNILIMVDQLVIIDYKTKYFE